MRLTIIFIMAFLISMPACSSHWHTNDNKNSSRPIDTRLTGTWIGEYDEAQNHYTRIWVEQRMKDGKYVNEFKVYKNNKLTDTVIESGRWWVDGNLYYEQSPNVMEKPEVYEFKFLGKDKILFKAVNVDKASTIYPDYVCIETRID